MHVTRWILVGDGDGDARGVGGLKGSELDSEIVADLQARVAAEIGQGLPFLLAHVIAVGLAGRPELVRISTTDGLTWLMTLTKAFCKAVRLGYGELMLGF